MIFAEVLDFNLESFLTPILDVSILIIFMIIMMIVYKNFRIIPIVILLTLISLIIGVVSIQLQYNPFTPWFQVFFILFQTVFFLKTILDYFEEKNKNR